MENLSCPNSFFKLDRFIQPLRESNANFCFNQPFENSPLSQTNYEKYLCLEMLPKTKSHLKSQTNFSTKIQESSSKQIAFSESTKNPFRSLNLPHISDDFYLNIIDWSANGTIAIASKNNLYFTRLSSQKVKKVYAQRQMIQICSVKFSNQSQMAIGNKQGSVILFDLQKKMQTNRLNGHISKVNSLDWNHITLASGAKEGYIAIWDLRKKSPVHTYHAHKFQICGLKWNINGSMIASGGNDNTLAVFDFKKMDFLVKFQKHLGAIKALSWCPQNDGLLAAGGGAKDKTIRFFNTKTLNHEYQIFTGSQVCNLTFSNNGEEMASTHGYSLNEVNTWSSSENWATKDSVKHTSILVGHSKRALYMASSPNGGTLATAASDGTVRFWHAFESGSDAQSQNLEVPEIR